MTKNWNNFLKNLGEWRGSFTKINPAGELISSTPSIINLEGLDSNQKVSFRVRRFPSGYDQLPSEDYQQEYSSLGRQNIFFDTGAFSKGTLQLAPFSEFGAEFGFIHHDRRMRMVQLFDKTNTLSSLTLIREFRSGADAQERPPLDLFQLLGSWEGDYTTYYADLSPETTGKTQLQIWNENNQYWWQQTDIDGHQFTTPLSLQNNQLSGPGLPNATQILLLADGASSQCPQRLQTGSGFCLEVGWLLSKDQRQRIVRSYSSRGEWISATIVSEHRKSV